MNPGAAGNPRVPPSELARRFGAGPFLTMDALEALSNAVLGAVLSVLITWLILGFTPVQSTGITAMFFGVSTARSYALRRLFRWLDG